MKIIDGGVTAAKGFKAAGMHAGIKKGTKKDMAMIVSSAPCMAAGTFTTNLVKAAPVKWDQHVVYEHGEARAVVVNSGIANACTGAEGYGYCEETAKAAAESIMTTDTVKKEVAVEVEIGGKTVTIGGMCKGSGMIHPNMCTMLSFLMTDAAISKEMLQKALSVDVDDTYNMISVDGDTSTNDTVLLLANGLAENPEIIEEGEDYQTFARALHYINETLAKKMAGDGEGATALFETKVIGAQSKEQAKILAKSVICSNLTKAAIFGHDANWGRILCAMGYSGVKFDPEKVDLYFESAAGKLKIIENGVALDYSEEEATKVLSEKAVTAVADIKMGEASASAWGCDLTYDYVKINADYRS